MFRNLPASEPPDDALVLLGQAMVQPVEDGELDKPLGQADDDENTATRNGELRLPAGYTYFGQFVDHDITFDPVSSLTRQNDPDALTDFRTPRFDLDSLYGRGPDDQPYLYEADGVHLARGLSVDDTDPRFSGPDLIRTATGRAIIGDPRNDENLIVSQLQVAFITFHNAVVDAIAADHPDWSSADVFAEAQRQVRWHYQWVVVHDFLPRICGDEVVASILSPSPYTVGPADSGVTASTVKPDLRFYKWHETPYMPVEFSVAAYRFGHSMIRPSYLINDVATPVPPVEGAARIPLFTQTGAPAQALNGFKVLEASWGVQWKYLLPGVTDGSQADPNLPQPSYKIDAEISHPLGALPNSTAQAETVVAGFDPSIAQMLSVRNLLRGKALGLPSGQDVARAMGIEPLTDDQLFGDITLDDVARTALAGRAPLWFYCLKEAKVLASSSQLGPVGGRIVTEVLIGILDGDPLSYLRTNPTWSPTLPAREPGTFTLTDIVNVAFPALGQPPVAPVASW